MHGTGHPEWDAGHSQDIQEYISNNAVLPAESLYLPFSALQILGKEIILHFFGIWCDKSARNA